MRQITDLEKPPATTTSGSPDEMLAPTLDTWLAPTLDSWTALDWSHGVLISDLATHDRIVVRTRNTTYEIIVVAPETASVMVRGGNFFPDFTPACLAGSSLGGGFIKLHSIGVGFQMELATAAQPVVTTAVQTFSIIPARDGQVM